MNEVNKTLYIPLYGKAKLSGQGLLLRDPTAEKIWQAERFPIRGKAKSKWLCYNMAMRAKVFDDWTGAMLKKYPQAMVLQIGCGLDARCRRVEAAGVRWLDCDFPAVIAVRKQYYRDTDRYTMQGLDATNRQELLALPDAPCAIVVMEGVSMYLTNAELRALLRTLRGKYRQLCVLLDVYTEFGANASRYKNPVHDVGVTRLYGVKEMGALLDGTGFHCVKEHSFTPGYLVGQLPAFDKAVFKLLFTGKLYSKIYRLFELESDL